MSDKYDTAIEYLTRNPRQIEESWDHPYTTIGGCLFVHCKRLDYPGFCGCLTQVKLGEYKAQTKELTRAIQEDGRLPELPSKITVESLAVFAEWQRRLDRELGRE